MTLLEAYETAIEAMRLRITEIRHHTIREMSLEDEETEQARLLSAIEVMQATIDMAELTRVARSTPY